MTQAESAPRIVRLLPARFSRDPKATKTTENTAAALLLLFTLAAHRVGEFAMGGQLLDVCWTPTSVFTFGEHHFEMTVKHLINDGLMTFFFFIVGLEVTREFAIGELTDRSTGGGAGRRRDRRSGDARGHLPAVQPVR